MSTRRPFLQLVSDSSIVRGCLAELLTEIKTSVGYAAAGTVGRVVATRGPWVSVLVPISRPSGLRPDNRVVIFGLDELRRVDAVTRRAA